MADRDRRAGRLLTGLWAATAASVVLFAWLNTGAYVRSVLTPLPGDAEQTLRECIAAQCAPNAASLISTQLTALDSAKSQVYAYSWSIALLTAAFTVTASVLYQRRQHDQATRFLGLAWKILTAVTVLATAAHLTNLLVESSQMAGIPLDARTHKYTSAFATPLTEFSHLYYLAWLIAVSAAAALLMRQLHRLPPAGGRT